jgi:hypothetical protein
MSTDVQYMSKQIIKNLVGWAIVGAAVDEDGESFGFIIGRRDPKTKKYERKTIWVDCDAEGNGPGWLNMEDAP